MDDTSATAARRNQGTGNLRKASAVSILNLTGRNRFESVWFEIIEMSRTFNHRFVP